LVCVCFHQLRLRSVVVNGRAGSHFVSQLDPSIMESLTYTTIPLLDSVHPREELVVKWRTRLSELVNPNPDPNRSLSPNPNPARACPSW